MKRPPEGKARTLLEEIFGDTLDGRSAERVANGILQFARKAQLQ
jgi:hypothetical protein